jgi:hypothetical protein
MAFTSASQAPTTNLSLSFDHAKHGRQGMPGLAISGMQSTEMPSQFSAVMIFRATT